MSYLSLTHTLGSFTKRPLSFADTSSENMYRTLNFLCGPVVGPASGNSPQGHRFHSKLSSSPVMSSLCPCLWEVWIHCKKICFCIHLIMELLCLKILHNPLTALPLQAIMICMKMFFCSLSYCLILDGRNVSKRVTLMYFCIVTSSPCFRTINSVIKWPLDGSILNTSPPLPGQSPPTCFEVRRRRHLIWMGVIFQQAFSIEPQTRSSDWEGTKTPRRQNSELNRWKKFLERSERS